LDTRPGDLTGDQQFALQALARQIVVQLELRKALARQRSSDERHRQILASAIDYGIISMDLTGTVTSWNQGAQNILGWSEHEMCGQPCDDFFTPEDRQEGVPEKEMGRALAHGRGSDERWHIRKDGSRFWASGEMMALTDDGGTPVGFLKILRDRTEFHRAAEALRVAQENAARETKLLSDELEHRVKNTLAMVQAIVTQSLRRAATPEDAAKTIEDRLISLARANDVLTRTKWSAAPIGIIIQSAVRVLAEPHRISYTGPDLDLSARAAMGLTLVVHELCTNAVKYGALSNATGAVHISWRVTGEGQNAMFDLTWTEAGGPPVPPPSRQGFGAKLIQTSLSGGPGGDSSIEYRPEGLIFNTRSLLSLVGDQ
jgi:PAS domain S-box-containing protein